MILAAGHGKRMRPLTEHTPKPLLMVGDKTLIEYHIEALANADIHNIVINTGRLGSQFEEKLGDGRQYGVSLRYSHEGDSPLETGGGICKALPLLESSEFLAVNGDIWTDYDFSTLSHKPKSLCHLILVNNPEHNPNGDFSFSDNTLSNDGEQRYTFSGIAVYQKEFFASIKEQAFSLAPLLKQAINEQCASAEIHYGQWYDIGTPKRLEELNQKLKANVLADLE